MKVRFITFLFFAYIGLQTLCAEFPFRTWTSSSGVKIQARLISFQNNKLTIERSDLKQFVFPLTLLSLTDQQYVKSAMSGNLKPRVVSGYDSSDKGFINQPNMNSDLPIWSPSVIDAWWNRNESSDLGEVSVSLLTKLRNIWTNKEKRSVREG